MTILIWSWFIAGIVAAWSEYEINREIKRFPLSFKNWMCYFMLIGLGWFSLIDLISNVMILRDFDKED